MSQENVQVVREGYDAFNRGNIEGVVATLDPDIEWWPAADEPITQPYRGHDGYRSLVAEIRDYVPDLQAEIEEVFAASSTRYPAASAAPPRRNSHAAAALRSRRLARLPAPVETVSALKVLPAVLVERTQLIERPPPAGAH
jgi:SnoaL-like domain